MLKPANAPPPAKQLLGPVVQEVIDDGEPDTWYVIREYDKYATARDTAVILRPKHPGLEFRASKGTIYARKVAP